MSIKSRRTVLVTLLLAAACSSPEGDDWTWEVRADVKEIVDARNADLSTPGDVGPELTSDVGPELDLAGETSDPEAPWPAVEPEGESAVLLDLLKYAWGGTPAAAVSGSLESVATGVDWEQQEGLLARIQAAAVFGQLQAPLQQVEGADSCALEVEGDTLTVVGPPSGEEPGPSLSHVFDGAGLEAAFVAMKDDESLAVDGTEFAVHCVDNGGEPVALSKVLTLADDGAKVALLEGGLEALDGKYDGAAALLLENKAVLCCQQGIYITGFRGALGAIAQVGEEADAVSCVWSQGEAPTSCEDACEAADDCREALCADGKDNDQDGATDCVDSDCNGQVCDEEGTVCTDGACFCESTGAETCSGGADEDCDGKVDCADTDCDGQPCDGGDEFICKAGKCQCPEVAEDCADGVDNNCDGDIDCDDALCLNQPCGPDGEVCTLTGLMAVSCECPNAGPEATCDDGDDNDCDGETDCGDDDCLGKVCSAKGETCQLDDSNSPVCQCSATGATESDCGDGKDDDCDGLIDCLDIDDCDEKPCGDLGFECFWLPGEDPQCGCPNDGDEENCGDGKDDDCDGDIDCADLDCADAWCGAGDKICNGISGLCECPWGEEKEVTCDDLEDNDCDGNWDCKDEDCLGKPCDKDGSVCMLIADDYLGCGCPGEKTKEEICNDGKDDDCDGKIDCADTVECLGKECAEGKVCDLDGTCACLKSEEMETSCGDGKDNDCDGLIDCADDDCPAVNCCLKGGLECQSMGCEKTCLDAGGTVGNAGQCWEQATCPCVDDQYEPNDELDLAQEFPLDNLDSGSLEAVYCPGTDFLGQDYFDVEMNVGDAFEATITVKDGAVPFDNPLSWAPPSNPNGLPLFPTASTATSWTVKRAPLGSKAYLLGETSGYVALLVQASTRFSYTLDWSIDRCLADDLEPNNTLSEAVSVTKGESYALNICQDDVDYLGIGTIMPNQKLTVTIQYTPGDYDPGLGWNIYLFQGTDDSGVSGTYGSPKQDPGGNAVWTYTTGQSETISDARISISCDFYFTQNPNYTFSYQVVDNP